MKLGGSENLVLNLIRKINRDKFVPSVAWLSDDEPLSEFKELDINLYKVPKRKRIDWSTMKNFGNIIKQNNIDIVNSHHFMPFVYGFYGSKITNKIGYIYTEHSQWEIDPIGWKWELIGKYLVKKSDAVVGVSDKITHALENIFRTKDDKFFTIINGVDIEKFQKSKNSEALRDKLGFNQDDVLLGIVANFKKIKNHIFLLKAFEKVVNTRKNVKLLLIGQGFPNNLENTEDELRTFVNENNLEGRIFFLGFRKDIPEFLGIIDICCLTSLKEGLPLSLLEAMAAGKPIIGTKVEGIIDVVKDNENGFLVKIGDVEALRRAIIKLIDDSNLRKRMANKSLEICRERNSLERCVNDYEKLFLSIVK
ncbi:glycosyltransferase family 4 protein [Thermodesulfobacteriota bacterium]